MECVCVCVCVCEEEGEASKLTAFRYFERDVECIHRVFRKKFDFECLERPSFEEVLLCGDRIDTLVHASGFSKADDDALNEVRLLTSLDAFSLSLSLSLSLH